MYGPNFLKGIEHVFWLAAVGLVTLVGGAIWLVIWLLSHVRWEW